MNEHRSALDKVAQALLEHETIEGRHVLEILKDGEIKSPIVMVRQPPRQPPEIGKPMTKVSPDAPASGSPAPSPA